MGEAGVRGKDWLRVGGHHPLQTQFSSFFFFFAIISVVEFFLPLYALYKTYSYLIYFIFSSKTVPKL